MPYYCYILKCSDDTFYTGWSTNPERRLAQHNTGRGSRYTRSRLPVELVYLEKYSDRSSAMQREAAIKRMSHTRKNELADNYSGLEVESETTGDKKPEGISSATQFVD